MDCDLLPMMMSAGEQFLCFHETSLHLEMEFVRSLFWSLASWVKQC